MRAFVATLALLVLSAPVWGQGAAKPAPAPADAPAKSAPAPAGQAKPAEPGSENIEQILEGEEQVLEGAGYTYDPGTRRDPFKSLMAAPDRPQLKGPRPEGIAGLLIDEIDLTGIFKHPRGFYVAQIQANNKGKSYLLKEGDQLYDGDVISINKAAVVFKQIVNDPTALKPFREVVKKLNP